MQKIYEYIKMQKKMHENPEKTSTYNNNTENGQKVQRNAEETKKT